MALDKRKRVGMGLSPSPKRLRGRLSKWSERRTEYGDFTVWRWCWKGQRGNGILRNSRLT